MCVLPLSSQAPEYERFPAEIMRPTAALTDEEVEELKSIANLVEGSNDLCSALFPLFVESFQQDSGHKVLGAVRRIAKKIDRFHEKGLHMSPGIVARVLRILGETERSDCMKYLAFAFEEDDGRSWSFEIVGGRLSRKQSPMKRPDEWMAPSRITSG